MSENSICHIKLFQTTSINDTNWNIVDIEYNSPMHALIWCYNQL